MAERNQAAAYRAEMRLQQRIFECARDLTRELLAQPSCTVPAHVLFPQLVQIITRYVDAKVEALPPSDKRDLFMSPYYGWLIERLQQAIGADTSTGDAPEIPRYEQNRGPGSTAEVSFWTTRPVREVLKSHVNYIVADTKVWEQSAAYSIDTHPAGQAFVKNAGLGFAIPYLHNGQRHDYIPDFIIRLNGDGERYLILETKGYDPLQEVKTAAARRWVAAVNAEGSYGEWACEVARGVGEVGEITNAFGTL